MQLFDSLQFVAKNYEKIIECDCIIKDVLNDKEQCNDIMDFCNTFSHSLPTPNIDNFIYMFDKIYIRICAGEIWEDIKSDLTD